jgi:hypothetical protein
LTTWLEIEQAVINQIQTIKNTAAQAQISTPLRLDRAQYSACFGHITFTALESAHNHYTSIEKPLKPCTGIFTTTTGLPCAHIINNIQAQGLSLLPSHFHPHWYWNRYSVPEPILEPLQVISHLPRTHSTRRIPSGFEASETQERRCGLCHLPGHTRASLRCPVNIRRVQQELSRPESASLFIPRSTVQSILDSATGQSTLKSALQSVLDLGDQLILKSTIQSILESTSQTVVNSTTQTVVSSTSQTVVNSTTLPVPESTTLPVPESTTLPVSESTTLPVPESTTLPVPESTTLPVPESTDTRPIWPGRPELIYQRYLAEKESWLTAHPTVRPGNYRKARGLEYWSIKYCKEQLWHLPKDRIDLQTETLVEGRPHWTTEEVQAWLDHKALEAEQVERQVEAELVAAGGFGQGRRRGVRSLWNQIEGNIQTREEQYRFV